ncbi:hypothetical protein BN1013_01421 [Candidatus Rubidus massiliensis]|mgnify:FL=1|nr:MAG: hypothetical protein BGO10_04495 [Chlamydia sp. 32-24]CDZ80896.1 hypothetical protein BN1013_01421 [Candidatus Rubidus massiliensis]
MSIKVENDSKVLLPSLTNLKELPPISEKTWELFSQSAPQTTVLSPPLTCKIAKFTDLVKRLEVSKKSSITHKIVSILSLAFWTCAVAAIVFCAVSGFFLSASFVALGLFIAMTFIGGQIEGSLFAKFNAKQKNTNIGYGEVCIAASTFGLSALIRYIIKSFNYVSGIEKLAIEKGQKLAKANQNLQDFIIQNYESLKQNFESQLEIIKQDLEKFGQITNKSEQQKIHLNNLSKQYQEALSQLNALHIYYLKETKSKYI